jgi:TonB family protein
MILLFPALQAQDGGQKPQQPAATPAAVSTSLPADSTKLEIVKAPVPEYPNQAVEKGMQGRVKVMFHISETRDVESTEIVSGNPILATAAEQAMKRWKFEPFIRSGKAVKVFTTLPYDFAFKNNVSDIPVSPPPAQTKLETPALGKIEKPLLVRISAGVAEGMLIHRVAPVYPPDAKATDIEGNVLLHARIGTDGPIYNLDVISGPPELVEAAIGAVEQWRYRPYTIDGKTVEVDTQIRVQYRLR